MRQFLDRQITRLWLWLVTSGACRDRCVTYQFEPGDEERLLAALISINDVLARAVRS